MSEISPILVLPTKKTNKISDMAKVAIKNENITSFGGIYHIMDVFSKLGFEKLTESVLGKNVEVAAKHSVMEVFFVVIILPHWFGWGNFMFRKDPRNTEASPINI